MRIRAEYERLMRRAIDLAAEAEQTGDLPIGALVVDAEGAIVGTGVNRREADSDPTSHAEIVAIREAAARLGSSRLDGCTLVTTLEPCPMCAGAVLTARISLVVFGAWDEKGGAAGSQYDLLRDGRLPARADVVAGVLAEEAAAPLRRFFRPGGAGDAELRDG